MSPQLDHRLPQRFWDKVLVHPRSGCWIWTASRRTTGYGQFKYRGAMAAAHRLSYEALIGPVPEGLELDHVRSRGCFSKGCVNPDHLEPVTHAENMLRTHRSHCLRGHPFEGDNLRLQGRKRACVICLRANSISVQAAYRARKKLGRKP